MSNTETTTDVPLTRDEAGEIRVFAKTEASDLIFRLTNDSLNVSTRAYLQKRLQVLEEIINKVKEIR